MKTRAFHLILALGFAAATAHSSETLSVIPDSAQALGIVGGRYANLNDASAVRVSPANILQIEKSELLINTAMWHADISFTQNSGQSVQMNRPWVFPASMYFVQPVIPGRLAFGIGVSTPYGLASSYPHNMSAPLRYALPYSTSLLTVDITPAVAFKVTENLSIAAGMDIMFADLKLRQYYDWSPFGGSEGDIQVHGQGWGLGAYGAINWNIAKRHRFVVVGRLPMRINLNGDFQSTGMPAGLPFPYNNLTTTSNFNSGMTFPGSISVGYGFDVTDRFTVGFDFKWSQNSSTHDLPLQVGNNQALLGGSNGALFNWQNSIDLGTGMTYKLNERWVLRGGYLFSENSQPQASYTPLAPANDRHVFSLGVGWRGKTRAVDLTYAYLYNPTRVISGSASIPAGQYDGSYTHQWQVLSLSITQRF